MNRNFKNLFWGLSFILVFYIALGGIGAVTITIVGLFVIGTVALSVGAIYLILLLARVAIALIVDFGDEIRRYFHNEVEVYDEQGNKIGNAKASIYRRHIPSKEFCKLHSCDSCKFIENDKEEEPCYICNGGLGDGIYCYYEVAK